MLTLAQGGRFPLQLTKKLIRNYFKLISFNPYTVRKAKAGTGL